MSNLFLSTIGPQIRSFPDRYEAHWVKERLAGWTQWILLEPAYMVGEALVKSGHVARPPDVKTGRAGRRTGGRKGRGNKGSPS